MEFKRTGLNSAEITTADGVCILFSYGEPVAMRTGGGAMAVRTERYISRTTEQHIAAFIADARQVDRIPHPEILRLTREAR